MFSHVVLGANDIAEAKRFYDAILGVVGFRGAVRSSTGSVIRSTVLILVSTLVRVDVKARGGAAVGYRTVAVVPVSRFELILVSGVPGSGCAAGAGRA